MRSNMMQKTLVTSSKLSWCDFLKDFVDTCDNNIRYLVFMGNQIGAPVIRDLFLGTMIVDVSVFPEDFNRLLDIYDKEWSEKYLIMNYREGHQLSIPNHAIIKGNTSLRRSHLAPLFDLGIFLDVYCFDNASMTRRNISRHLMRGFCHICIRWRSSPCYFGRRHQRKALKGAEAAHENEPRLAVPSCHGRRWP